MKTAMGHKNMRETDGLFWIHNERRNLILQALLVMALAGAGQVQAEAKDDPLLIMGKLDQFEVRNAASDDPVILEGQAWIGRDLNKIWLKAELEYTDGESEEAEVQVLYSSAIAPYWDIQMGLRKDFQPTPSRSWAVFGLQGLAPYFFEVDTAFFVGDSGRTAWRIEAEYELLLTQRLILTPEIEVNFFGQNDEATGTGSGLSDLEFGLRLRYEIRREFAPYIGINWSRKYGKTADFARGEGAEISDTQVVVGIRAWF